ncbi:MAG: glutathione S-transferase N-terminal domain-containing protein [Neomegalonema sp.]|nr:glutathione S-transferase N-terminal domain-containing protein [Neomegalonema sp.]
MSEYVLHCFAQSGNAYKAALMLNLIGADWQPRYVAFFKGAARTPEFSELNAMGEVPVLEIGDEALTQSGVILTRLARESGRFGGTDERESDEILRWLLWDNHKLTANLATHRFLNRFLAEDKRDPAVIAFLAGRARAAVKVLEARLSAQDFVALPDRPTIADLSCVGYLYYEGETAFERAAHPAISAWLDRIASLEGWAHPYDLMPGHPIPE